ncbi:MAG TPA: di-heme oxidoredictase family protein [Steroidobacteraceae bacterium]
MGLEKVIALLTAGVLAGPVLAQDFGKRPGAVDPGPRPVGNQSIPVKGAIFNVGVTDTIQPKDADGNGAGRQLPKLTPDQTAFWFASLVVFGQQVTVDGAVDPSTNNPTLKGLGPAFNADSCGACHAFPAIGGTSPPVNPQIALAKARGAQNSIPPFISLQGPVREARFVNATGDGLPRGAVHPLFTIQGRSDAPSGCSLQQPDFAGQFHRGNVALRIPTPTFGVGYIENTTDEALATSFAATQSKRARLGIFGHFNTNGNDQTITRFGWKAQNKSLLLFSGEAANVEMGLTNELFSNERSVGNGCDVHALPEDTSNIASFATLTGTPGPGDAASVVDSGIVNFGVFMRLNAAPSQCAFDSGVDGSGAALCTPLTASTKATSIANGQALFRSVGCVLCHTETLTTSASPFASLNTAAYHPYSDFAVHGMGRNLADGVVQGSAAGDEFRTAPLWGLGQRVFFLHDGRTSDLLEAIAAHQSAESEANGVIRSFDGLSDSQKQDVLNFLRSL